MTTNDNVLGDFLKARRELLDPQKLGVPDLGRRRVPGLRREELAMLAGVSSPYYTRLEQGRDRHPSPQIIEALGRALELDEQARAHLHRLATPASPLRAAPQVETVSPGIHLLLQGWSTTPALVVGRYRDVLAANRLAQTLNSGFVPGRNLLEHTFLDPEGRQYYLDWLEIAEGAVAGLRASAGATFNDARLTELVGELSLRSQDFSQLWARHDVRERTGGRKRYNNPFIGHITLSYETFGVTGQPGQTLFLFHAEPGSGDERSLELLADIAADSGSMTPSEKQTAGREPPKHGK